MAARRTLLATLCLLAAFFVAGVVADRVARARVSPESRAAHLAHVGNVTGAEAVYWSLLQDGPVTVPLLVSFLDAHERAIFDAAPVLRTVDDGRPERMRMHLGPVVAEVAIDALLARADLAPGVGLLGRYWRGVVRDSVAPEVERDVVLAADANPPVPWANHLLAEDALRNMRLDDAANRFLREGASFEGAASSTDGRAGDIDSALTIWVDSGAWERVHEALDDRRVAALADPWLQVRVAIRARDWKRAARAYPRCLRPSLTLGTVLLASIAALAWGAFCARLGGLGARPRLRAPLYLSAFVLGFASVGLTLAIVALEEGLLQMTESGNPLRDALFFTFGVGLREEGSKLLFFAPLLPLLHRKGTRLDVLVCGALVGLGFAAEENLNYLRSGDLATGMARFLTANFLHMSMTAILAGALDDLVRAKDEDASMRFSKALLLVAALHGAYDFFLSSRTYSHYSFLAMMIFLFLARWFLALVSVARAKERAANARLLETFGLGMAVVVGTSFVYASALVGPAAAASSLAEGLLGLGIIIILFVQQLRRV
jgi:RsiW-degrading membrane proteinase PrsW (M82 family)